MSRLLVFSFVIVSAFAAVSAGSEQRSQRRPNRPPSIESFTSSSKVLEICPFASAAAVWDKPEVTLLVKATDPDGDALLYDYSITEGKISGEGSSVVWHLEGLPRGPHEVRVTLYDGYGGQTAGVLTVTTVDSGACDPPRPPCPVIKVSCQDEVHHSKRFRFAAVVESAAERPTSFNWKVNAGRIVKGQNSREIEVTATGTTGFGQHHRHGKRRRFRSFMLRDDCQLHYESHSVILIGKERVILGFFSAS